MSIQYDVIIIGAGAAGMMSAIEAGKRGRKVLLVDHYKKIGEKIRISGGGRCNFTNINTNPSKFLSQNPKFVRSALSQYTQNDFINLINKYEIKFHEKKLGQLFCDHSARQIVEMLLKECELANVTILKEFIIKNIEKDNDQYLVEVAFPSTYVNGVDTGDTLGSDGLKAKNVYRDLLKGWLDTCNNQCYDADPETNVNATCDALDYEPAVIPVIP